MIKGWIGILVWGLFAQAALGAVEMDLRLDSPSPRSEAPIPVVVRLKGDRPLMEGRLTIALWAGNRRLIHYETDTLVVTNQAQERRLLVPAIGTVYHPAQCEWRLRFTADSGEVFNRNGLYTTIGESDQHIAVVGLVHPLGSRPPTKLRDLLNTHGRLETMMGTDKKNLHRGGVAFSEILTWTAALSPDGLPGKPLALCGYDLLVMTPTALEDVSQRQVQALKTWLRAGGRLLVARDAEVPLDRQVPMKAFLEALPQRAREVQPRPLSEGHFLGVPLEAWQWDHGRVVVVEDLKKVANVEDPDWRKLFQFLWDVRDIAKMDADIARLVPGSQGFATTEMNGGWSESRSHLQGLLQSLMPSKFTLLPVGRMAMYAVLFLLVVGPLEYFLLGLLKRRWLTWFVFPITLMLLTYGAFVYGNQVFGADVERKVTWVDLSSDGQEAVREQTIRLRFGRGIAPVTRERKDVLTQVLPLSNDTPALHFEGRFPGEYTTRQESRQWTPLMETSVRLGGRAIPEVVAELDWGAGQESNVDSFLRSARQSFESIEGFCGVSHLKFGRDGLRLAMTRNVLQLYSTFPWTGDNLQSPERLVRDRNGRRRQRTQVPFPRIGAPRGDSSLRDLITIDYDQWWFCFEEDDELVIYRYLTPSRYRRYD